MGSRSPIPPCGAGGKAMARLSLDWAHLDTRHRLYALILTQDAQAPGPLRLPDPEPQSHLALLICMLGIGGALGWWLIRVRP